MDINAVLSGLIGAAGGAIVAPILFSAYKSLNVSKYLFNGAKGLGSYTGMRSAVYVKRIKDKALRDQVSNDIKNSPNEFDKAFDKAFNEEMLK